MDQLEYVQQIKARGEQVPAGEEARFINVIVLTDGAATGESRGMCTSDGALMANST